MMFERIPKELKDLNQWVCAMRDSKIPMKAFDNAPASSTSPETWSPYSIAQKAVEQGNYDNIGFVFADNGIVGIDIDIGFDEDGFVTQTAADIIQSCHSYTEKSRSGRGFHILVAGDLPFKGKNNLRGIEIYKASRYFIMTGNVMLYDTLIENQTAIDGILETYFSDCLKENNQPRGNRIYIPTWEKPQNGRIKVRPVYSRIPNGCRNICLTSLAGMLHNQGYSPEQIYDELTYCNDVACDPCLDSYEIQTIVGSVTRYKR